MHTLPRQMNMTDHDRSLWLVWAGLVLLAVIALPFLARHHSVWAAAWGYCRTMLGLS